MAKQTFRWKRQSLERRKPTTSQLIHQLWKLFAIETYQVIFRVSRPVKRHVVRNELANLTEGRSRLVIRNAASAHILRPRLILLEFLFHTTNDEKVRTKNLCRGLRLLSWGQSTASAFSKVKISFVKSTGYRVRRTEYLSSVIIRIQVSG